MRLEDISTPALCVDVDVLDRNIRTMADFFADKPAGVRPHIKAHKTPAIARMQADAGFAGFTCATVGEAEMLVRHLFADILIANEICDPTKLDRVRTLAHSALLTVAVDSFEGISLLKDMPIGAVIDVNVGMPRCGADPADVVALADAITQTELHLSGVMGYEGHAVAIRDRAARTEAARASVAILAEAAELLRGEGYPVTIVSAGGTGTYDITGAYPGITEVQAGSYALMDTDYAQLDLPFEEALRCLCTVLSVHDGLAVLDAGLKALATDHGNPLLPDDVPASVLYLADEHTTLVTREGFASRPGDRVWLRPSHVDPTVNLHDRLYAIRDDDEVVDVWPVDGRGYALP